MYLKFGNYTHSAGETRLQQSRRANISNGMSLGYTEVWQIHGQLHAADPTSLTAAIIALQAAYSTNGQNVGFYDDNGAATAMSLLSASCIGGTRVVGPVQLSDVRHGQYTTYVDYDVTVEGDVADPTASLIEFRERLEFRGGGPRRVLLETMAGPPVAQIVKQQTIFYASQSGLAIGRYGYPGAPSPLFPFAEMIDQRAIGFEGPERFGGPLAAQYVNFRTQWSYQFQSATPLWGTPNLWPI